MKAPIAIAATSARSSSLRVATLMMCTLTMFLGNSIARRAGLGPMPCGLELVERFAHRRVEALAASIHVREDRVAHARVPERLDVVGDPRHHLVGALRLEKLPLDDKNRQPPCSPAEGFDPHAKILCGPLHRKRAEPDFPLITKFYRSIGFSYHACAAASADCRCPKSGQASWPR